MEPHNTGKRRELKAYRTSKRDFVPVERRKETETRYCSTMGGIKSYKPRNP